MRLPPVSVSMPIRISWACSARRTVRLRWSRASSWRLRQLGQRRHGLEVGVDLVEQVLGQLRQGGAQPADPPRHLVRRTAVDAG